ncbi:MAG: DUF4381 domain-containing protein [Cocleimonas sp.]
MEELPLQDIHLPAAADFWPLAFGWWLVLALFIALIGWLGYKALQYKKHKEYRAAIYAQFDVLGNKLEKNPNNTTIAEANTLLRKLAIHYYPRTKIASLTGENWLKFLDESGDTQAFSRGAGRILIEAPYRSEKHVRNLNTPEFIRLIKSWAINIVSSHS